MAARRPAARRPKLSDSARQALADGNPLVGLLTRMRDGGRTPRARAWAALMLTGNFGQLDPAEVTGQARPPAVPAEAEQEQPR